jgi:tetratricopeptide (TPR) repeat protein
MIHGGQSCACGSGLSRACCCELDLSVPAEPAADPRLGTLEARAKRALGDGHMAEAEKLVLEVLEYAPRRVGALATLYKLRNAQCKLKSATTLVQRIVRLEPGNFWATNELTLLLLQQRDLAQALYYARNAIRIDPHNAQSHALMGMALTEARQPAIGAYHYEKALQLLGNRTPVLLANLALCLRNQGNMQQARELYREAHAAQPDNLDVLLGWARLEEADRKLPEALELLDRVAAVEPRNPRQLLLRAGVLGRQGQPAEALAVLDHIATERPTPEAAELLEKGALLDKLERYDEAFAAFDAGKQRLREVSGQVYQEQEARLYCTRLKAFFIAARMASLPRATRRTDVAQPLFVLGFPRSGTTLLQQSLTVHPRIAPGNEPSIMVETAQRVPRTLDSPLDYPDALAELWMGDHRDDLDVLRDFYLRKAAQLGILPPGAAWFTDKMPLNETEPGLIHLLFPHSPLLHVTRHPLDVVLSMHATMLTHGYYCATALDTAARHYALIDDLVQHYRRELELRYLRVRYEDLVDRQEATMREVFAFIGETFDPACLAFHENQRYAHTASYAQVAQKLYDRSRYRYRNYLKRLEPVIPILQPAIERMGYSI